MTFKKSLIFNLLRVTFCDRFFRNNASCFLASLSTAQLGTQLFAQLHADVQLFVQPFAQLSAKLG